MKAAEKINKNCINSHKSDGVIAKKKRFKKFSCIDLFCGCGGLSLGFKEAGFNIIGAIDFNKAAMETHKKNFNTDFEFCGDIASIEDDFIKQQFKDKVDVIIGGPPCQGFSGLNRRNKDGNDPRNMLFLQYLRFVKLLSPKVVLIENVRQILTAKDGFVKNEIFKILDELGYNVTCNIVDASDYGVPQARKRAIFIGTKKDLKPYSFDLLKKQECEKVTVSEAISDIADIEQETLKDLTAEYYNLKETHSDYQKIMRSKSNDKLFNHLMYYPTQNVQKMISYVPQGGNWKYVPKELFKSDRDNRQSNYLKRLEYNSQSITIDTGHNVYFHPVFNRVPTIRESARLQSFPDDFIFYGKKGEQFRQVGNAVPPLMAKAIAKSILEIL